jgi:hypothetical protein
MPAYTRESAFSCAACEKLLNERVMLRSQILPLAQREPREWRRVVAPPALMAGLSPAQRSTGYRRANLTTTQTASP